MARGNDMDTAQAPRCETQTFDPRGAFSWTLRSGEIARLEAQQGGGLRDRKPLESKEPRVAQVNGRQTTMARSAPCETQTFDPRGAFSWTLRSGEIARLEAQQQRRHRLLLKLIAGGRLDTTPFITHRFPLDETMSGYDTFAAAPETHALKVVLEAEPVAHAPVPAEEALAVIS